MGYDKQRAGCCSINVGLRAIPWAYLDHLQDSLCFIIFVAVAQTTRTLTTHTGYKLRSQNASFE